MPSLDIPADFPLTSLIGQELTQVCIGRQHVRLHFYKPVDALAGHPQWEPGAGIDIEAGFELQDPTGQIQGATNGTLGVGAGCLTTLLGQVVTACDRLERNELLVWFASRSSLRLCTDPFGFESYHLHISGESVDVTACQAEL